MCDSVHLKRLGTYATFSFHSFHQNSIWTRDVIYVKIRSAGYWLRYLQVRYLAYWFSQTKAGGGDYLRRSCL